MVTNDNTNQDLSQAQIYDPCNAGGNAQQRFIAVGCGYSVDLIGYHDAVAMDCLDTILNKVFGNPAPQSELEAYYNKVEEAVKEGKMLLINISNHSSSTWSDAQKDACGNAVIADLTFPNVNPSAEADELDAACFCHADWLVSTLNQISKDRVAFLVAGAQGALFRIVGFLKMAGYTVLEATSCRNTIINDDGSKTVRFDFVRFRAF